MKRLPILSLVCLAVLLGGCTREVQPSAGGEVGPETWVTIPFACSGFDPVQIATRSDIGIIAESRVKNIFLFIFKSDGRASMPIFSTAETSAAGPISWPAAPTDGG